LFRFFTEFNSRKEKDDAIKLKKDGDVGDTGNKMKKRMMKRRRKRKATVTQSASTLTFLMPMMLN
jgi:hypothetical protein